MKHAVAVVLLALATACSDSPAARVLVPTSPAHLSYSSGYGDIDIHIQGWTYGPDLEEWDMGVCVKYYNTVLDSTNVGSPFDPVWVKRQRHQYIGCQPLSYGGPYYGGDVQWSLTNSSVNGTVAADATSEAWLLDTPKVPSEKIILKAVPHGGHEFLHFMVYDLDTGQDYMTTSDSLARPLDTKEWRYVAYFRKL